MKLTDLSPKLYAASDQRPGAADPRASLLLTFMCPVCKSEDDRVHVPLRPHQPRGWDVQGTTVDNVTLAPSIQAVTGCKWHGFITNSEVTNT